MGVFLPCLLCFGEVILVLTFNWIRLEVTVREKNNNYGSGSFKSKKNQQMRGGGKKPHKEKKNTGPSRALCWP